MGRSAVVKDLIPVDKRSASVVLATVEEALVAKDMVVTVVVVGTLPPPCEDMVGC